MARQRVYLLPLDSIDLRLLDDITAALEKALGLPVGRLLPMPVPEYAYDEGRGQYHSTTILKILERGAPEDALRVLAVADVDLYIQRLNFVFGEATVDGLLSIISLYRLRPEFYGDLPDDRLFSERAAKEAIHELGHTLGLLHCSSPQCVMYFSNCIADTDRKSAGFCGECGEKLGLRMRALETPA